MTNLLKQKFILLSLILQLLALSLLNGQVKKDNADLIYKKDSSVLSVKIVDIIADSITYKAFWNDNSKLPIFTISKKEVIRMTVKDDFGATYDIVGAQGVKKPSLQTRTTPTDKIYKKDGSVISVKILRSLGDTLICQSYWSKESPVFGILKTEVDAVVFRNGATNCYTQRGVDSLLATLILNKQIDKEGLKIPTHRNVGIGFNLGGPSLFGSINMDIFLSRNFSLEFGAPLQLAIKGFYGGAKLHMPLASKSNTFLSFYTGCILSRVHILETSDDVYPYFPIGIHSTNNKGFILSGEAAVLGGDLGGSRFWWQIRLGKRFRRSAPVKK
jgi:hypothetical protein